MIGKTLIRISRASESLLANLENRNVALWVRDLPDDTQRLNSLVDFLSLPWSLVLLETFKPEIVEALEIAANLGDPMVQKRGFPQIVDSDPSRIELPSRCLPIYLLNGREVGTPAQDFQGRLRRMAMVERLRRSGARETVVLASGGPVLPPEMIELWASGFRTYLTLVIEDEGRETELRRWLDEARGVAFVQLLELPLGQVIEDILTRYTDTYPEAHKNKNTKSAPARPTAPVHRAQRNIRYFRWHTTARS